MRFSLIGGIDEVGRGPIAGPITLCLFISGPNLNVKDIFSDGVLKDSKKLKKAQRISIFKTIRKFRKLKQHDITWYISSKPASYIDKYGLTRAIDSCINSCVRRMAKLNPDLNATKFYLDGGLRIKGVSLAQETIIKGDEKCLQIALASIIAKVTRDRYMSRISKKYRNYAWDTNVGYATRTHRELINSHGLSPEHRVNFILNKD